MQVYVITGGTRGIGAGIARALSAVSERALVLAYRGNHERAKALVGELDRPGSPVRGVPCAVADPGEVSALFAAADELGELVGLVNNAAIVEGQCSFEQIE